MATFFGRIMAGCCIFIPVRGLSSLEEDTVGEVFCLGGVVLRVGLGRAPFCIVAAVVLDFEPWTPPPLAAALDEDEFLLRAFVGFVAFLGGVMLWWVELWGVVL